VRRSTRLLTLIAMAALALLAATNVGVANPMSPTTRQAPACNFSGGTPTLPCTIGGQLVSTPQEIAQVCNANPMACSGGGSTGGGGQTQPQPQPCAAGQTPTMQNPCIPAGMQGGNGGAGGTGGLGGAGGAGGLLGGMPNIDWGSLKPCAPGQMPSPTAPCKFEMADCAEGQMPSPQAPCKPKPCPPGVRPTRTAPCIPEGQDGGFEAPPTAGITKELKNKFMVINISVQGSGEVNGSFDVTFRSVEEGVSKQTAAFLNEQLEGESFVIQTDASTRCFADTKDPDKVPDLVSCKTLDDAANNAPGSIKAQFRGKVSFDQATYQPQFKAQKIIFLKGVFNVAKIGG
jgi:hypothetical protein